MKFSEIFNKVVGITVNYSKKLWPITSTAARALAQRLFGSEKGVLRKISLNTLRLLPRLWIQLKSSAFKVQNVCAGWIIRLRVLHQSSRHYRSLVLMGMSALGVSMLLALLFLVDPMSRSDADAPGEQTSSSLTGSDDSEDDAQDDSAGSADSEEFPSDIFSDEALLQTSPDEDSSSAGTTSDSPSPSDGDDVVGQQDEQMPAEAPAPQWDEANLEALKELRRNHDLLSEELEVLREESIKRREQNERNRKLLENYELEVEKLRKQLSEQSGN